MKNDSFRDRTKAFALRIIKMYCNLPKSTQAQVLGRQVLRSGTSVAANYREASRVSVSIKPKALNALFTRNGGEHVDIDRPDEEPSPLIR